MTNHLRQVSARKISELAHRLAFLFLKHWPGARQMSATFSSSLWWKRKTSNEKWCQIQNHVVNPIEMM